MRFTRAPAPTSWSDDQLEELRRLAAELEADARERMPHVDDDARDGLMRRIALLNCAIGLMADPAT